MIKAKLLNQNGEEKGEVTLNSDIFEVAIKKGLVHQALQAFISNKRQIIADTKDKSEVRGGGKKPWRQKGTGRARHGSSRSPIWKGGGVTFGPTSERNFTKSLNKKMRNKAIFMVLSDKAKNSLVNVVEEFQLAEIKTKSIADFQKKTKLNKVLIVIEKMDKNIALSANNLPKVNVIAADSVNIYELLKFNNVMFTKGALTKFEKVYLIKETK